MILPTSHEGASFWVGASPYSKEELAARLGDDATSHLAPHITLPIHEVMPHGVAVAGKALHAVFSRQELAADGYGFGVIPWLDCSAEGEEAATMPSSEEYKEATLMFLRQSTANAMPTTPQTIEARMVALVAGKSAVPKTPQQIFPEFTPAEEEEATPRGWFNEHVLR